MANYITGTAAAVQLLKNNAKRIKRGLLSFDIFARAGEIDAAVSQIYTDLNTLDTTLGNVLSGSQAFGDGTLADPAVKIGSAENGFYQLSATQLGVSIGNVLHTVLQDDGIHSDGLFARVEPMTAAAGCTAISNGDGRNYVTEITLTSPTIAIAGAAAEANGVLVGTFPAGAHLQEVTYMSVALQGTGTVDTDTPDVGIGSAIATGAVSVLGGTPTFEDYITGQTAADCNGTATVAMTAATAGYGTGISLNASGDTKTIHLNVADTWAGADTITATGKVVIKWTVMD